MQLKVEQSAFLHDLNVEHNLPKSAFLHVFIVFAFLGKI